ncbi:S8 family serine peptidase [Chromobacterium haemolyticum]|nr:S8 family serine peptidase [Chromobacterium haemolyticum]
MAAGNAMKNVRNTNPASCPGVITVASNGKSGSIASYSNYGAITTVTAPGGDLNSGDPGIYSTLNSGTTVPGADSYAAFQGTSMATPHVAGLVALMLSSNPSLNWKAVRNILIKTARPPAADCEGCSAGITDAAAAVRAAKAN